MFIGIIGGSDVLLVAAAVFGALFAGLGLTLWHFFASDSVREKAAAAMATTAPFYFVAFLPTSFLFAWITSGYLTIGFASAIVFASIAAFVCRSTRLRACCT